MTSGFEKIVQKASFPQTITKYFPDLMAPERMTPSRIADYQRDFLKEILSRAFEKSAFYRSKMLAQGVTPEDLQEVSDLKKFPFTTKDELRRDPWARLACDKKDICLIHVSTGTTGGKEIYSPHTWREYCLTHVIVHPELIPVTKEDICYVAMPYEMSQAGLNFHNKFMLGFRSTVVPVGKGGAYSSPEKTIRLMRHLQPNIVVTSPSHAMTLSAAAEEAGLELSSLPIKKMWISGEGCSPAFRERVEKLWGTKVNFSYGATECGFIGVECDQRQGYHILQSHLLIEIVDPETGEVLEPGKPGEIVITSLLRLDTPLIRFRTQDMGYIDDQPCACGVNYSRLFVQGRSVDQVVLKGKRYSPYSLEQLIMEMPEVGNWYEFIVSRTDNDRLRIRSEVAKGVEISAELAERLATQLEQKLGVPCEWELVSYLPRTMEKAKRVVVID